MFLFRYWTTTFPRQRSVAKVNSLSARFKSICTQNTGSTSFQRTLLLNQWSAQFAASRMQGHPFSDPSRDDEDVHIFVRWNLKLPRSTPVESVVKSIKSAFDLVWQRADAILENSDSVLILGKDTGPALDRLKRIESRLQDLGYYTYIIKEQPDKAGEGVIQKVMRYALSAKFVLIENTEASGHLYEIPHVTKAAECVTVVLQEEGKGATWMFEDAYARHRHWHKLEYKDDALEAAVEQAAAWAEELWANSATTKR